MSSFKGQLFSRGVRTRDTGGSKKSYRIDGSLFRVLGQGTKVLLHLRIWSLDAHCQVTVRVLHGCLGQYSPDEEGFPVLIDDGTSSATAKSFTGIANVKGHLLWTDQSLLSDVLVEVEVEDNSVTNIVAADFELWATVLDQ